MPRAPWCERAASKACLSRPFLAASVPVNSYVNQTNNNLRSFGYGLTRKPRIFQSRDQPRARAQSGAAWRILWTGASRCLWGGALSSRPFFLAGFVATTTLETLSA